MTATIVLTGLALVGLFAAARWAADRLKRPTAHRDRTRSGRDGRTWDELDDEERAYLRRFFK